MSEDPAQQAMKVLAKYPLCDRCLGRLFAGLGRGLSNAERGRALKLSVVMSLHAMSLSGRLPENARDVLANAGGAAAQVYVELFGSPPEHRSCYICNDALDKFLDEMPQRVADAVKEWGGSTFLVGAKVDPEVIAREERIKAEFGLAFGESIKSEIKRELGKRAQLLGPKVSFDRPDVVVMVSFPDGSVSVQPRRLVVKGLYRRLRRDLQLRPREALSHPLVARLINDTRSSRVGIVGLVRDEKEVRALGLGIPVEFHLGGPRVRLVPPDGSIIEAEGASLEVNSSVEASGPEDLSRRVRVYRCVLYVEGGTFESLQLAAASLRGKEVRQKFMGKEVSGVVRGAECVDMGGGLAECIIALDERLHVMELVSGSGTEPSLSGLLGTAAECVVADLLGVIPLR